jgi:hypothetical protein
VPYLFIRSACAFDVCAGAEFFQTARFPLEKHGKKFSPNSVFHKSRCAFDARGAQCASYGRRNHSHLDLVTSAKRLWAGTSMSSCSTALGGAAREKFCKTLRAAATAQRFRMGAFSKNFLAQVRAAL